jgi:hypothetical protein
MKLARKRSEMKIGEKANLCSSVRKKEARKGVN